MVRCEGAIVTDGERALQYLHEVNSHDEVCPQLVILDLNLPRRSGADVLRKIRASPRCGDVPVVILTSSENQFDRDEAARLGATRFLVKPFDLDGFLSLGVIFKQVLRES
jgi:CheY-like chemotaxis protein